MWRRVTGGGANDWAGLRGSGDEARGCRYDRSCGRWWSSHGAAIGGWISRDHRPVRRNRGNARGEASN